MDKIKPGTWKQWLLGEDGKDGNQGPVKVESSPSYCFIIGIVFEFVTLLCVAAIACVLRFTSVFPVTNRNITYLCFDIMQGEEKSHLYVPDIAFYLYILLTPLVLIALLETAHKLAVKEDTKTVRPLKIVAIPPFIRRIFRFSNVYLLGLFLVSILVDSLKLIVGRPRPYYLSEYYDKYCTGKWIPGDDLRNEERNGRLSFPSFHATLSAYSAFFLMVYTHTMLRIHGTYTLRPILNILYMILAVYPTCEYYLAKHNYAEDIIIGFIIGIFLSLYMTLIILRNFKEHPLRKKPDPVQVVLPRAVASSRPLLSPDPLSDMNGVSHFPFDETSSVFQRNFRLTYPRNFTKVNNISQDQYVY